MRVDGSSLERLDEVLEEARDSAYEDPDGAAFPVQSSFPEVPLEDSSVRSAVEGDADPALERLAEQSMRFSQAYSPHPNCSSTRMSIQTGKSPARLGTTDIYDVNPGTPGFIKPFYENCSAVSIP